MEAAGKSGRLEKGEIAQAELWRLAMVVGSGRVDVALYPPVAREEILWRSFQLNPEAPTPLKALEDIVYDNPLLLSDFKAVDCIIDNVAQTLMPTELDEDQRRAVHLALDPQAGGETQMYPTGDPSVAVALSQREDIHDFLCRTFYNAKFDSRLAALCRYFFGNTETDNSGWRFWAPIRDGRLTLIGARDGRLMVANNYESSAPTDAAYYIMASIVNLGADPRQVRVALGGCGSPAPQVRALIEPYVGGVDPLPFPTLRYRATPSTLQAPIDLLIRH